eukprot:comp14095_c0_seq1/m.9969 comp14095_c0_seq1/g.9969  ORF comp14095_c0_seq1/g.9969 comp14095_c0_seq1/m.9969 type:complete len:134 (-) comp14095_c0_seq1:65-466(-)
MEDLPDALQCVLNELVTTERTFVEDMTLVVNEYMIPSMSANIPGFGPKKWKFVFNNVQDVVACHVRFLSSLEEWWPDVESSFFELSENYEVYRQYISRLSEAQNVLDDGYKNNPGVKAWLDQRQRVCYIYIDV